MGPVYASIRRNKRSTKSNQFKEKNDTEGLEKTLEHIYTDASSPGGFAGVQNLYREARKQKINVTKTKVEDWLSKYLSFTLHKPVKKRFKRNKTIVFYIDELWQMDLCDTKALKKFNDNATFILTVIDVFSKTGFARSLLNKKGETVTNAMIDIMEKTGRTPSKVQTDLGTEFKNKIFENELRKGKIQFYVTFSETKAAVVERFNRTLKGKMWKYFTHANTFRYIDILPQLLEGYNATPHSSLDGLCPVQINQTNQPKIWRKTFAEKRVPTIFKYKVNDTVRITRDKKPP